MSFLDRFRRKALTASPAVVSAIHERQVTGIPRLGGTNYRVRAALERAQSATYGYMYANQPAVRTVVDLVAENVSQLGLKLYERVSDTERQADGEHPAAVTMRYPNEATPPDQWIFEYVADRLVYHNAYAIKFRASRAQLPLTLVRIPAHRVSVLGAGLVPDGYRVYRSDGSTFDVDPEDMMHWRGYNPDDPRLGVAPLETLRLVLAEDAASQAASTELARNGLLGGHIERPLEAPEWSEEARGRFQESWRNQTKVSPRNTPVLEEGMEFKSDVISPKDAELLKSREFTLQTVARLYGVPVELFFEGDQEEARKRFYADVLAPVSEKLASQLDHSILRAEYAEEDYYFEFDLNEKLRGDPEKRFAAITSAVGAPWMLRDEARSLENLPPVEGGDEIVTPLNVLVGKNPRPAPNVMPPQDPNRVSQDGDHREPMPLPNGNGQKALEPGEKTPEQLAPRRAADMARQKRYIDESVALLEGFYRRQLRSVKSAKGRFNSERWNRELAEDLRKQIHSIVEREGGIYTARLAGHDFDTRHVENYVRAQAEDVAAKMNEATERGLREDGATDALERAIGERALVGGTTIGARATTFAREEAAKQAPHPEHRMKTWVPHTARHAQYGGSSVPLGSDWGGISPGSEPNCACMVEIS